MSSNYIFDCVIIGDIFIDINIRLPTNEITKGGVTVCEEFIYTSGGISNIATALSLLGCKVAVIGKCGHDIFGNLFIRDIKKNKIISYIFRDYLPTGLLISLIDISAERSFIITRGANNNLNIKEVQEVLPRLKYRFFYSTGYSLTHSPQRDSIIHAMEIARRSAAITIFDPGSYNIIDKNYDYFIRALKFTNILSCNLEEARAITNAYELKDIILYLAKIVHTIIIRLGKKGCIVYNDGDSRFIPLQLKIRAKDTTGAGDAFTSALIYGLINGWNVYKSAYFANLFAAMKVTRMGARSFPSKKEIKTLLQKIDKYEG
ncbi:MAG: carbohydrate kinase family protein [Candidatus Anstonellales archaeon]